MQDRVLGLGSKIKYLHIRKSSIGFTDFTQILQFLYTIDRYNLSIVKQTIFSETKNSQKLLPQCTRKEEHNE